MFIHAEVRAHHILLPPRIQQKLQRVKRTIGIPQSIINIKVMSLGVMHSMIVTAEVSAILCDIGHATERPVKCSVEDRALSLGSSRYVNAP